MLLKFGSDENILDLFENGTIYMNTIQYFKNLEKKEVGDSFEGSTQIRNYKNAKIEIKIKDTIIPLKTPEMHLKESHTGHVGNLYSIYAITPKDFEKNNEHRINEKISSFGSSCLLIYDSKYFLDQIESKLNEMKIHFEYDMVRYQDYKEIFTYVGPFDKSNEYEHQNEFRVYAKTLEDQPLKFQIGSLKGKAEIFRTSEVISTFSVKIPKRDSLNLK